MNEKNYKKRLETQSKVISRQSEEIESLNAEIVMLRLQIEEKDNVISSIEPMRKELSDNIAKIKKYKNEYKLLIEELKKMKDIVNQEVYKNRWKIIKFLMK
jgi:prefoldin subunit 5